MRDFQRDVLSASDWQPSIQSGDFSWSLSRMRLFDSCLRAYFINHHLAQGGWNQHANHLSKAAFIEKNAKSFDEWTESLFENALTDALKSGAPLTPGQRSHDAPRILKTALRRMLDEADAQLRFQEWREDPKRLNLLELYYAEGSVSSPNDAAEQAEALLFPLAEKLLTSSPFLELLAVEHFQWRDSEKPVSFGIDGITVWLPIPIAWLAKGRLRSIEFRLSRPDTESASLSASLFALFADSKFKAGGRASLSFAFPEDASFATETPYPIPETLADIIKESSAAMLSKIRADGSVDISDFPTAGKDKELCAACRFRGVCQKIPSQPST